MTPATTSVILPGRDVADVVGRQLEALCEQEGADPWELVFIDDGSTDGTLAVVESFRARLPHLVVVRADVGNAYAARNLGLAHAGGALILCCDADDQVPPGWVAGMQAALASAALVGGPNRLWWPHRQKVDPILRNTVERRHLDFLPFASGGSFGCRREVFDRVGPWDAHLPSGGDADLCWRAQLAGFELVSLPATLAVLYRQPEGARAAFTQQMRQGQGQARAYRRYREAGMPRRSPKVTLADWWGVIRKLPGAVRSRQLEAWAARAGVCLGRVVGSVRNRVVYL